MYPRGVVLSAVSSSSYPILMADAQEGMRRSLERVDRAGQSIISGDADPGGFVDLIVGQRTYEMNAKVLRTGDEMLGTLLNVLA